MIANIMGDLAKIDHHGQQLDRIATDLEEDLAAYRARVAEIEPEHRRFWDAYTTIKWIVAVGSGGGLLALLAAMII